MKLLSRGILINQILQAYGSIVSISFVQVKLEHYDRSNNIAKCYRIGH